MTWQTDYALLSKARCPKCYGSGECDDAEPGDTSYRTWECKDCKGTGYAEGEIPLSSDIVEALKNSGINVEEK